MTSVHNDALCMLEDRGVAYVSRVGGFCSSFLP